MIPLSQRRHNKIHKNPVPYLTLPFAKTNDYQITEGWMYSLAEKRIHHFKTHAGIDFHLAYGTPVYAPCGGLAMASYHSYDLTDEDGKPRIYQGKQVSAGLGYFVQIYNQETKRSVQVAHMFDVAPQIPFSPSHFKDGLWNPTNHNLTLDKLINNPAIVTVQRGDLLGYLGYSGMRWGYTEHQEGATRPIVIDPEKYVSFDEPHIHLEEFVRDMETGKKRFQRDPYDIYLTASHYPTHKNGKQTTSNESLFLLDQSNLPEFAI